LKASKALLKHISVSEKESLKSTEKKSLIADADNEELEGTPIWLTLTTKKHITDQKRLKPAKIALPYSLNTDSTARICLITADPQRTYKDIIASPAFPAELAARISKVIGVSKVKSKWTQYEAQRKLLAEHDIFLADDRIITQLPKLLGKTFYKSTVKRPIPISLQEIPKTDGKRIKKVKGDASREAASPKAIAAEIEKVLQGTLVHLSPSTNTSVRVGFANWDAEKLSANIEAVTNTLIEKFVPKKWRGVRSVHIKGPETAALPIWLADELWTDDADVLDQEEVKKVAEANVGKKRKAKVLTGMPEVSEEIKKKQKLIDGDDGNLNEEIRQRKERLRKQKEEASKEGEDEVPVPKAMKKVKKGKAVVA
jgi:ribosome biogenesis protein UTP30